MDVLTVLPNLSIGVVAIITLGYITREFIKHLRSMHQEHKLQLSELHREHLIELKERETALREVEREVRTTIAEQLSRASQVIERAVHFLDNK